jgi:hypothetical protein
MLGWGLYGRKQERPYEGKNRGKGRYMGANKSAPTKGKIGEKYFIKTKTKYESISFPTSSPFHSS